MACGVPVVATAVGGLTDTVVDSITGDLVSARDPLALTTALRRLLADDARRLAYAAAASDRAGRSYSWRRVSTQLTAVYVEVAGATPGWGSDLRGGRLMDAPSPLDAHLSGLATALPPYRAAASRLEHWGRELAWHLGRAGRLLVAGNGGSAAEAQHLAAELVGRLRDERAPLSAIALTPDSSAVTAIANDYGFEVFARQVRAHGRPGDVLMVLSTSGRSPNLVAAVRAARETGLRTWTLVGAGRSPFADACDEALCCPSGDSQVVQELHLISVHVMCEYVDRELPVVLGIVPDSVEVLS